MELARLARIPERCRRDLRLIYMLRNWREALSAEWNNAPLSEVRLRNRVILSGPQTIDLAFLFHEIWVRRVYTPPGYEIEDGNVVLDVGANIGVFATYAATRAESVAVYAYEPFPENIAWLKKNVEESGLSNVHIFQQAVAGSPGTRFLQSDPEDWIMHSLGEEKNKGDDGLEVDCTTLDEIMSRERIKRCDLLKLDCEGSEYEILWNCAPDTLRRVRRIVAEFHEGEGRASTGRELRSFLERRSFRVDRFQQDINCGYLSAYNTEMMP
jgi:FkbM family methyltransferase